MRIALAQTSPTTGDLEGNTQQILAAVRRARELGCHLVLTPEAAITGAMSGDLLQVDAYVRANKDLLRQRVAPEVSGIAAVIGFVDYEDGGGSTGRRYNAAAAIQDGRVVGVAHKQHLCNRRHWSESRHFAPGSHSTVVKLKLEGRPVRVGLLISEDICRDGSVSFPCHDAVGAGADMLAVLSASPFETGGWQRRLECVARAQADGRLPVLFVNSVGIGDNMKNILAFDGRSVVFDSQRRITACGPFLKEDLVVADLSSEMRGAAVKLPEWKEEEELLDVLCFSLRQYAAKTGFSRAVLGMSGGVDSALCAAIACDALGAANVLGVSMPSRLNTPDSRADAELVCRNLGMPSAVMPIEELYGHTVEAYGKWRRAERDVSLQNIQARLRGLLLMAISNEQDRLLIATGNKTEIGQGYCTLYGDTAGALLLIGDLNKMQVYALAECVNRRAGRPVIPASVIERVPSAELTENQRDPFDYPVVAPLVDDIIALRDPAAIVQRYRSRSLGDRYPADLYERYDEGQFRALVEHSWRLYVRSAFKRAQSAPVVVVSPRAVGFDLRETTINAWRPHHEP